MLYPVIIPPAYNLLESFIDACREKVHPKIGSILYCDLFFGYMEHSGIYIGNNKIVHLSGKGNIEIVTPKQFIDGGTACNIYVSCHEKIAVGRQETAIRARKMVGKSRDYNFILDNCHQFSSGCLTGNFDNASNFLWMLKHDAAEHISSNSWRQWDIELL